MLEKIKYGKRVSKSGVGAGREKGGKIVNTLGKWYPNRYDQSFSHAIIRNLRQHVH